MSVFTPGAVILVTGASGGIGFEIAAQAARAGAIVGIHGLRAERVDEAIARLRERAPGARFIAAPGDFREAGCIEAVVSCVAAEGGRLDAVIHCAITGAPGTSGFLAKTDPANYGIMAAQVLGIFQQLCFVALPHLAQSGGGTIIGFASDAGRFAAPRQSIVSGVFGGIMAFVRSLATEVGRDKVRVHCISPSYVTSTPVFDRIADQGRAAAATDRAPLGLPSPADIAPLALFLCGPGAEKITGQVISINGGLNA